jgi:ketosteroid isomerase-like protein
MIAKPESSGPVTVPFWAGIQFTTHFEAAIVAKIVHFGLTAAAALIFVTCGGNVPANNANADDTSERAASAGPNKVALITLEKSAYQAWKSKDAKFWVTFLSDKFVGWGSSGKLDKVSATKEYIGTDCEIKSYALSDEQLRSLGKDAALITYKATVNGTCGGQQLPTNSQAAAIYVRDDGKWKRAFHARAAIVDPKATPAKPVDGQQALNEDNAQPTNQNARTEAMLADERYVWEAWRAHDAKRLADLTARDISFINIFGVYLATKSDAMQDWSGTYCDVKSISLADAAGTMLSPTVGILTFKASADGTCYGQKVGPVWGSSVYVKYGDVWKWSFGINLPARREGT